MITFSQSAADKSYRRAALPFALFMLVGGMVFSAAAFAFPAHALFLPPFSTEFSKRAVFFAMGLCVFAIGVGYLRRRVWALYAFVMYVLLGTAWHVGVGLVDPNARWLLCSPLINLPIGFAVYWATRSAFPSDGPH